MNNFAFLKRDEDIDAVMEALKGERDRRIDRQMEKETDTRTSTQ